MKYAAMSRENALGWMARRERRACPQRPVESEQRRQTAQDALALRVAPLCSPSPALLVSYRPLRYASSSALERRKIGSDEAWLSIPTGS